jgi:hypothetical protein
MANVVVWICQDAGDGRRRNPSEEHEETEAPPVMTVEIMEGVLWLIC